MSEVIPFEPKQKQGADPKQKPAGAAREWEATYLRMPGVDTMILKSIRDWRVGRAKQSAAWAKIEHGTLYGHVDTPRSVSLAGLAQMRDAEERMLWEPATALAACEMLRVAVEIMAHRAIDPEQQFAKGPVLEIVRNVLKALERVPGMTELAKVRKALRQAAETVTPE